MVIHYIDMIHQNGRSFNMDERILKNMIQLQQMEIELLKTQVKDLQLEVDLLKRKIR